MNTDDISLNTSKTSRNLRLMMNEVENQMERQVKKNDQTDPDEEDVKMPYFEKLVEKLSMGMEECLMLEWMSRYVIILESEKVKNMYQLKRLHSENEWLKNEVSELQKRRNKVIESVMAIRQTKEHYRYVHEKHVEMAGKLREDINFFPESFLEDRDDGDAVDQEGPPTERMHAIYVLTQRSLKLGKGKATRTLLLEMIRSGVRKGLTDTETAFLHELLAMIYRKEHNFPESSKHLRLALPIRQKCNGTHSAAVKNILTTLSICESKLQHYADAQEFCEKALEIQQIVHGGESLEVAKLMHNLGLICTNQSKFPEARQYFENAIKIYSLSSANQPKVMKAKSSYAVCLVKQNDLDGAEVILKSLIDEWHTTIKGNRPRPEIDPSIYMIVDQYSENPQRAITTLNETYGVINDPDFKIVVKNFSLLYKKKNMLQHMHILSNWLKYNCGKNDQSPNTKDYNHRYKNLIDQLNPKPDDSDKSSVKSVKSPRAKSPAKGSKSSDEEDSDFQQRAERRRSFAALTTRRKSVSQLLRNRFTSMISKDKK